MLLKVKNPTAENLSSRTWISVTSTQHLLTRVNLAGPVWPLRLCKGPQLPKLATSVQETGSVWKGTSAVVPGSVALLTAFSHWQPRSWFQDDTSCGSCLGLLSPRDSRSKCPLPHPDSGSWLITCNPPNSGLPCNCYRALSISCDFLCLSTFGCILKSVRLPCFCKDLTIPATQCSLNWTSCCLNGAVCPSPRH